MASNNILFVLLSFGLYLLFVLVPIIPAALLYRWFPESQVTAKGVLSKFTINSSGAFAAYMVTVLLGYFLIGDIKETVLDLARNTSSAVWIVRGTLQFQDRNGNTIEEASLYDRLYFDVKPDFLVQQGGHVELKIPGTGTGEIPQYFITVNVDGFGRQTIPLAILTEDEAEIDTDKHLIILKSPVVVKTMNDPNPHDTTMNGYIND